MWMDFGKAISGSPPSVGPNAIPNIVLSHVTHQPRTSGPKRMPHHGSERASLLQDNCSCCSASFFALRSHPPLLRWMSMRGKRGLRASAEDRIFRRRSCFVRPHARIVSANWGPRAMRLEPRQAASDAVSMTMCCLARYNQQGWGHVRPSLATKSGFGSSTVGFCSQCMGSTRPFFSTNIVSMRASWTGSAKLGFDLSKGGVDSAISFRSQAARFDRTLARFDRLWPRLDRRWPRFGRTCTISGAIRCT